MSFRSEFPNFPPRTMPAAPPGFGDASSRHDPMPCFINLDRRLALWIDYLDPALREFPSGPRFFVTRIDGDGVHAPDTDTAFYSDDWKAVLNQLDPH